MMNNMQPGPVDIKAAEAALALAGALKALMDNPKLLAEAQAETDKARQLSAEQQTAYEEALAKIAWWEEVKAKHAEWEAEAIAQKKAAGDSKTELDKAWRKHDETVTALGVQVAEANRKDAALTSREDAVLRRENAVKAKEKEQLQTTLEQSAKAKSLAQREALLGNTAKALQAGG